MDYKTKEYHKQRSKANYESNKEAYQAKNAVRRERTRQIINEAKAVGCKLCPESHVSALDFHHLGDKDIVVSQMLGMSDVRVRSEIEKCVVLCANCHRKVHAGVLTL